MTCGSFRLQLTLSPAILQSSNTLRGHTVPFIVQNEVWLSLFASILLISNHFVTVVARVHYAAK